MLYFESKRILNAYENKEGSIDSLISKSQFQNKALLKALVSKILQYRNLLNKIIKRSKILEREQYLGETLAQLLVYDVLFGTGVRGKFKSVVKRNFDALNEACDVFMQKYSCSNKDELLKIYDQKTKIEKPKYIFMNTLELKKKEIYKRLKELNYVKIEGYSTIE
jgi:25S rRNA (cytosine2278-C5)-methyltransferase